MSHNFIRSFIADVQHTQTERRKMQYREEEWKKEKRTARIRRAERKKKNFISVRRHWLESSKPQGVLLKLIGGHISLFYFTKKHLK